ncbi:MAG: winged helix-turn-helix domain-containing protein [Pseudomonadota bacterium]
MLKELTWRKAVEKVLTDAPGAVHYKDITDKIMVDGLRTSLGATPAATVSALLATAIKNEAGECPFQKVGKGLYIWKKKTGIAQVPEIGQTEEEAGTVGVRIAGSHSAGSSGECQGGHSRLS